MMQQILCHGRALGGEGFASPHSLPLLVLLVYIVLVVAGRGLHGLGAHCGWMG
jgi:hypothetical protein